MKIVSYCLYGSDPKYHEGLIRTIPSVEQKLPGYKIILWVPQGFQFMAHHMDKINRYKESGLLSIMHPDIKCTGQYLMFYRFTPASMPDVSVMYCKDLDSPILERELEAMREFESSDKMFLIIRDHPSHRMRIIGGMWGAKYGAISDMKMLIKRFLLNYPEQYGTDETFLQEHIYPRIIDKAMIYDSFNLHPDEKDVRKFKTPRVNDEFVQMVLNADGSRVEMHHDNLRAYIKNHNL